MIIGDDTVDYHDNQQYHCYMYLERRLKLLPLLKKKSLFLLGPRAIGKSTLIREQLKDDAQVINLLKSNYYLKLSSSPADLESLIIDPKKIIVIDEIQKIPQLLDEVHRLIEEKKICFLLTGSSARKIKRGAANLLAGRAWNASLLPLTSIEIPNFDLETYLQRGGLPTSYLSEDYQEELNAYLRNYLYEEIQAEGIVRKLPAFSRFLEAAALSNGQLINYANIANDTGVSPSTVREYYQILSDTLLGFKLPPWTKSKKRKAISTAKFYFFDVAVANALQGKWSITPQSDDFGRSFEHFIANELQAYLSYERLLDPLTYWRSTSQLEVDFIVGTTVAIEVKAKRKLSPKDLKGLKALKEEGMIEKFYLITHDPIEARIDDVHCLPWDLFLKKLWTGEIV